MTVATATAAAGKPHGKTVLLYGDSGDGKTALVGEMAEHVFKTTGLRTRLATADRGGLETIKPYVDLGIVQVEPLADGDPFMWLNKVVRGERKVDGKWVRDHEGIGLWAFEGLTSVGDALMQNLSQKSAQGINIGGGSNVKFDINADGTKITVGGSNQAHYGIVQTRIVEEVWESQRLPGWLMWTAAVKRDDDQNSAGKVLGPAVVGKALTGEVPRWFVYSFRVGAVPGAMGAAERHVLYLGDHTDLNSGGAKGLGNTRVPLDAPKLPATVEPASIVKALAIIEGAYAPAVAAIKGRLGLK